MTGWGSTILETALEKGMRGSFVEKKLTISQQHVFAAGAALGKGSPAVQGKGSMLLHDFKTTSRTMCPLLDSKVQDWY